MFSQEGWEGSSCLNDLGVLFFITSVIDIRSSVVCVPHHANEERGFLRCFDLRGFCQCFENRKVLAIHLEIMNADRATESFT